MCKVWRQCRVEWQCYPTGKGERGPGKVYRQNTEVISREIQKSREWRRGDRREKPGGTRGVRESSMWVKSCGNGGRGEYTTRMWMSWNTAEESDEGNWGQIRSLDFTMMAKGTQKKWRKCLTSRSKMYPQSGNDVLVWCDLQAPHTAHSLLRTAITLCLLQLAIGT